jgi:hypothetical protein
MKPTDLFKLIEMWERDSAIDKTEPGLELAKIPNLHSKYAKEHVLHSLASQQCGIEYSKMKKLKWEYYNGRMSEDELKKLGWEQFGFLLKSDISIYIDSDEDLTRLNAKKTVHDQAISFLTMVIKELGNRTFQLRALIDFEKFIQGQ